MSYLIIYILYSCVGFYYLKQYHLQCNALNIQPFGLNIYKIVGYSLMCGLFTTIILLLSFIWTLFEHFSKKD